MHYLGIDPGITGALCLLDHNANICEIIDMPIKYKHLIGSNKKSKKIIDSKSLECFLSHCIASYGDLKACLEDVHGRGGWSAGISFNFGETFGSIRAVLELLDIPIEYVIPQLWKKHYALGQDKEKARNLVINIYKYDMQYFDRKKDHNRAEALLIARYVFLQEKEIKIKKGNFEFTVENMKFEATGRDATDINPITKTTLLPEGE